MNIHEYQAKELLAQNGVAVPSGHACQKVEQAVEVAKGLFHEGHSMIVIKSQIHAGGRGKGTFKSAFREAFICPAILRTPAPRSSPCWVKFW